MITHKLNEIKEICEMCTVIRHGKSINTFEVASKTEEQMAEMMVGRAVNFEVNKVIENLNLEVYNFANEILHESDNYPWLRNDKLNDIVLV